MKKSLLILLTLLTAVFLVACGNKTAEVTIPASFVDEEKVLEDIKAEAEEIGISDVTENEDGSITFKMSRATHKNWLRETAAELDKSLKAMVESDDLASIKDIFANKNYSELNMIVDQEAFENSFDGFAILGIGFSGAFYQLLEGADSEDLDVIINIVDERSGDTIDTVHFPDDLSAE